MFDKVVPIVYKFSGKGGNKKGAKKSAIILLLGLTRRRTAKTEQMEQQGVRRSTLINWSKFVSYNKKICITNAPVGWKDYGVLHLCWFLAVGS